MAEGKTYELSEVVGVTVQSTEAEFIIHPNTGNGGALCYFSDGKRVASGDIIMSGSESFMTLHFSGYEDTQKLLESHDVSWGASWAVNVCNKTTFGNGENGYLMSLGEASIIRENIGKVDGILGKINGADVMSGLQYWTSSLNTNNEDGRLLSVWYVMDITATKHFAEGANVQNMKYVRPIARLINN